MGNSGFVAWPHRPFPAGAWEGVAPTHANGDPDPKEFLRPDRFPRHAWNPDLRALSLLAEFAGQDWRAAITLEPPSTPDDSRTVQEIGDLVALARQERARRAAEILDQDIDFHDYFAQLLMLLPQSHPETFVLFKGGARVAEMLMVAYKIEFERPRPQQVYPRLLPLLDAPGHSSYPSGHATIGRLIALCLADAVPPAAGALMTLSERIGHNREVAGLHYHSDTLAGFSLAEQAFAVLKRCDTYRDALKRARQELAQAPAARARP